MQRPGARALYLNTPYNMRRKRDRAINFYVGIVEVNLPQVGLLIQLSPISFKLDSINNTT